MILFKAGIVVWLRHSLMPIIFFIYTIPKNEVIPLLNLSNLLIETNFPKKQGDMI